MRGEVRRDRRRAVSGEMAAVEGGAAGASRACWTVERASAGAGGRRAGAGGGTMGRGRRAEKARGDEAATGPGQGTRESDGDTEREKGAGQRRVAHGRAGQTQTQSKPALGAKQRCPRRGGRRDESHSGRGSARHRGPQPPLRPAPDSVPFPCPFAPRQFRASPRSPPRALPDNVDVEQRAGAAAAPCRPRAFTSAIFSATVLLLSVSLQASWRALLVLVVGRPVLFPFCASLLFVPSPLPLCSCVHLTAGSC